MKEIRKEKINLTDKDVKLMKVRNGVIRTNYKCQIAATENQVIVAAEVTTTASDVPSLMGMIEQLEKAEKGAADSGYSSLDNYEELEEKVIDAYISDRNYQMEKEDKFKKGKKRFHIGNFKYNKKGIVIYVLGEKNFTATVKKNLEIKRVRNQR